MACPFTSIDCVIRYDNARVLTWTLKPGINYPEHFALLVENSRAGGPWTVLSDELANQCTYVDSRKRNYNTRLNECYRLKYVDLDTGETCMSAIVDAGNHRAYPYSADAENILKQVEEQIKISGCTGKLLKKKVWGHRCPLCTDFKGQATVNEHCPRCLGTGVDGGYFPGIKLDVIKDSISTPETPSELGYLMGESVQCRCIAYPWIHYGDVWCEDNTNKRYVINKVTPSSSYKTTHLIYTMTMTAVENADILHSNKANELVQEEGAWENKEASTKPAKAGWDEVLSNTKW